MHKGYFCRGLCIIIILELWRLKWWVHEKPKRVGLRYKTLGTFWAGKLSTEEFCTGNYHHHHHHCHHHKSLSSSSSLALPLSPSAMAKQTPVSWITPTHVTYIRGSRCSFQSFQPGDGDILMGIIIIVTIIIYLVIAILHMWITICSIQYFQWKQGWWEYKVRFCHLVGEMGIKHYLIQLVVWLDGWLVTVVLMLLPCMTTRWGGWR